jgi:hypothetical protein
MQYIDPAKDRSGSKPEFTAPQQQRPLPLNQQTSERPDLRWFCAITVLSSWQKCRADSTPSAQRST